MKKAFMKIRVTGIAMVFAGLSCGTAWAGISLEFADMGTLSSTQFSITQTVALAAGDVVVMTAASNKKYSVVPIAFTSTGGACTMLNAAAVLSADPNPDTFIGYFTVISTGSYDFHATATASITANIGLYRLSASSGSLVFLANDAAEWANLAPAASLSVTNALSWSGDPGYGECAVIGSASSLRGNIGSTLPLDDDNSSKRLAGSVLLAAGTTSYDAVWTITNADATRTESGSAVVLAFAEGSISPQPPEFKSDPVVKNNAVQGRAYEGSLADDAFDRNGDPMHFEITTGPEWLELASDGALSGIPLAGDVGTNSWIVSVTDGISGTNSATLQIVVRSPPPPPQTSQTNIVLIVVDDLGWMDLSIQGSSFYETPRIDGLAQAGMRFMQGYAAHPRCVPSRYGLMTGKFPGANGVPGGVPDAGNDQDTMRPWEVTLAEALHAGGYATCFAGKWHLIGTYGAENLPQNQGFEVNIAGGKAGAPPTYFYPYRDAGVPAPTDELSGNALYFEQEGVAGEYVTDRITDEALEWMDWNADRPMFLCMWHYGVHTPFEAPADLVAKYEAKLLTMDYGDLPEYIPVGVGEQKMRQDFPTYAAMIESVDTNVGRLLDKIDELGITGNTVVIFTGDNGGLSNRGGYSGRTLATSNLPLRTGKGWLYEGGIREAFIVKGAGVANLVNSNAVVTGTDIYPTCLELAGLPLQPTNHQDGISFVAALTGAPYDRGEPIFWHSPLARPYSTGDFNSSAVRDGDYKLIWFYDTPGQPYELYNVKTDPGENTDLSESNPAKAAELLGKIQAWHAGAHEGTGVVFVSDVDDVAKPPKPYLADPTVPPGLQISSGNVQISWDDWIGYDFNLWTKTHLTDASWTPLLSGTTATNAVDAEGIQAFYKTQLVLQPEN